MFLLRWLRGKTADRSLREMPSDAEIEHLVMQLFNDAQEANYRKLNRMARRLRRRFPPSRRAFDIGEQEGYGVARLVRLWNCHWSSPAMWCPSSRSCRRHGGASIWR